MALHLRLIAILGVMVLLVACNAQPDGKSDVNPFRAHKASPTTEYWLDAVGRGDRQTSEVCERGDNNAVTRALCREDVDLTGLKDLYKALGIETFDAATSSLATAPSGLSHRTSSPFNPRLFVTQRNLGNVDEFGSLDYQENLAIVAFSRGEQLVELVAYDADARQLTFYLLAYEQSCNTEGCSAAQLLGQETESNWTSWTLYDDSDLIDTPLDCLSCHQPEGEQKRLLMRDIADPWYQWMSLDSMWCDDGQVVLPDLKADFNAAHPNGYGALSTEELEFANGHNLHSNIISFRQATKEQAALPPEPFMLDSSIVLDAFVCHDRHTGLWQAFREATLETHGFPIPYFGVDTVDTEQAEHARRDWQHYLQENADMPVFDLLNGLIAPEVEIARGGYTDDSLSVEQLLQQSCVRCHDDRAPEGSARARFRVDQLGSLTPELAKEAIRRINLPRHSPELMPPESASTLSEGAKAKLSDYLMQRAQQNPIQEYSF